MIADIEHFIVDASVLIKFLVKEEGDEEALKKLVQDLSRNQIALEAPFILEWEIGNFLGREFQYAEAIEKYSLFKCLNIRLHLLSVETTHHALQIMHSVPGASFYDASYHALALSQNTSFLTCDYKYHEKAKHLGGVVLLKDYGNPLLAQA